VNRISKVWTCSIHGIVPYRGWSSPLNVRGKAGSHFDNPVNIATARPEVFGSGTRVTTFDCQSCFVFAHLARCAAAILARPSALILLNGGLTVAVGLELRDRPRFAGMVAWSFKRAFARSSLAISASIVWMISVVSATGCAQRDS
jgi:hypothetical protein